MFTPESAAFAGEDAAGLDAIACSLHPQHALAMTHGGAIAGARRAARMLADSLGFGVELERRLGVVVGEAATNMLRHAGGGQLYVSEVRSGERRGVEVVAIDRGPGIANAARAMGDGTSDTGLAGMRNAADEFDLYTAPGNGTAVFARLWSGAGARPAFTSGALCSAIASEQECGDAWAIAPGPGGVTMMAVDGLGHGPGAARAAQAALRLLAAQPALAPRAQVEACHQALRKTAGAVLAVAHLDYACEQIRFAGIGNISACVGNIEGRQQMASYNGVIGHSVRKVQEFSYPCPKGSLVILHSDGVSNRWDLAAYPGLAACHPALIAAVLLRDFRRSSDDAQVLVVRYNGSGPDPAPAIMQDLA